MVIITGETQAVVNFFEDIKPLIVGPVSESLLKFKSHRLEEVSLDSLVEDLDAIKDVFRRIASVRAGARTVGATATSKVLHLVNPRFFMMSDRNIRHGYGYSDDEVGYAKSRTSCLKTVLTICLFM